MQDVDDILKHAGIKGMKWGVRKSVSNAGKAVKGQANKNRAKSRTLVASRHEKYMSNKKYARDYSRSLKRTGNKLTAMRTAQHLRRNRNGVITRAALSAGLLGASNAYKFATKPETIRAGRNLVQAAKKSPIRYVDGSTLSNVINAGR